MIPFFSLRGRQDEVHSELLAAVDRVLASGQFIGGSEVERFESAFADYAGHENVVGVGNGLDALSIALTALGVQAGDEVIVPAFTFIATPLSVIQSGARVVFADVDIDTGQIDPESVKAAIGPATVAIVAVHLFGRAAPMRELRQIAQQSGLLLFEDAAQAHGLRTPDFNVGSLSDAVAYSFYPTKNLGAIGDAGAIATPHHNGASTAKLIRSYGALPENKYEHILPGRNSRLDPIQAAALSVFLPKLDEWNSRRRTYAQRYMQILADLDCGLEPLEAGLHSHDSVWHHFVVRAHDRDSTRRALHELGVMTDVHYPYVAANAPFFLECRDPNMLEFPNAQRLSNSVISLPMHPWLSNSFQVIEDALAQLTHHTVK